jgi:hypothetical protein
MQRDIALNGSLYLQRIVPSMVDERCSAIAIYELTHNTTFFSGPRNPCIVSRTLHVSKCLSLPLLKGEIVKSRHASPSSNHRSKSSTRRLGKCCHHGFIGESILGGLLDFFECGLALLLSVTPSALRIFPLRFKLRLPSTSLSSPKCEHLRSSLLSLFPKVFNNPHHLFPPFPRIHLLPTQTHTHFLIRTDLQQPLHQQMPHIQTHKNPTV